MKMSKRMDKNLQIRIPADTYESFKQMAAKNAQTPSLLIRKWIEDYIEKNQK
jgi:predicted DNA-binding protein